MLTDVVVADVLAIERFASVVGVVGGSTVVLVVPQLSAWSGSFCEPTMQAVLSRVPVAMSSAKTTWMEAVLLLPTGRSAPA